MNKKDAFYLNIFIFQNKIICYTDLHFSLSLSEELSLFYKLFLQKLRFVYSSGPSVSRSSLSGFSIASPLIEGLLENPNALSGRQFFLFIFLYIN